MKRKIIPVVLLLGLLAASIFYIVRVPPRGGYLGPVSISVQHYKTNAAGQVDASISITNSGPHTVRFAFGTQTLRNSAWVDAVSGSSNNFNLAIDPDPLIPPHSGRIVSVRVPATTTPWRVYAVCQKEYSEHWSKSVRWVADAYILKRGVVEHFNGPEIQR